MSLREGQSDLGNEGYTRAGGFGKSWLFFRLSEYILGHF